MTVTLPATIMPATIMPPTTLPETTMTATLAVPLSRRPAGGTSPLEHALAAAVAR